MTDELTEQSSDRLITQEGDSHELAREWAKTKDNCNAYSMSPDPLAVLGQRGVDRMAAELNRQKAEIERMTKLCE